MGWIIGRGNSFIFRQGGGTSWQTYWSHQSEVLFFGLYSEISGGQMPNKVTGATDYLTIAGVAGSETYQCPNTADYIAADTDYIWFKTDESQRTVTTAELVGYDFPRTPVKYDDDSPYAIVAIMILKSGETITGTKLNRLFQDMWLHTLWDNNLNAYGHIKGNKLAQTLWIPEIIAIDTFTDTDGKKANEHIMDAGNGWAASDGWTISGNKLTSSDEVAYYCITDTISQNGIISADIAQPNALYFYAGIVFRYQDSTHHFHVVIQRWGTSAVALSLMEVNGAPAVQKAAAAITRETATRKMKVSVSNNTIDVYWDDMITPKFSYTSSLFSDKKKHGITVAVNAQYVTTLIDNFLIEKT